MKRFIFREIFFAAIDLFLLALTVTIMHAGSIKLYSMLELQKPTTL